MIKYKSPCLIYINEGGDTKPLGHALSKIGIVSNGISPLQPNINEVYNSLKDSQHIDYIVIDCADQNISSNIAANIFARHPEQAIVLIANKRQIFRHKKLTTVSSIGGAAKSIKRGSRL